MRQIISQYAFGNNTIVKGLLGDGHIHDTYLLEAAEPSGERAQKILQRINRSVFPHPEEVMENIAGVTEHLRRRIGESGGDPGRQTLRIVPTKDGALFCRDESGEYWRVYDYIDHAFCPERAGDKRTLYQCGRVIGNFLCLLADYPADSLYETIPSFHDTRKRVASLKRAVRADAFSRASSVEREIAFFLEREQEAGILCGMLADGELPLRVTHNDAKPANLMLDEATGEGLCVIDLDTVMPGSAVYDFGELVRAGASTASEDGGGEVFCSMPLFEACVEGFLGGCGDMLTETEKELLPLGAKMMTYENGVRFLTDYLEGDHYYKIGRPDQNLDRARNQMRLVADMERKWDEMQKIVKGCEGR